MIIYFFTQKLGITGSMSNMGIIRNPRKNIIIKKMKEVDSEQSH